MLTIIKPQIGGHDGSSFRELIDMWSEANLCKVKPGLIPKKPWHLEESMLIHSRPWAFGVGEVLLYDNPIFDKLHSGLTWKLSLWSNAVKKGPGCLSWIFWPRYPKIYAKHLATNGIKKYSERKNSSVFIGTYTTQKRNGNWGNYIQNYWMGSRSTTLMPNDKYLEYLGDHKFGLSLPGVGPKCLRDIELIGLGTVPIFTPGVCTDYHEPLVENKHFLYADKPEDIPQIIKNCNKEKWEYMSNECVQWYIRNCSVNGSYRLTEQLICENYKK